MREASDTFAAAVRDPHRVVTRVEVWRDGEPLVEDLPIGSGDLAVDDTQAVPGEVRLGVPGREWDPIDPFHPLAPFGQQLYVSRGIRYPTGEEELIGLGWFLITDSDPNPLTGETTTTAASLEELLAGAKFRKPYQPKPSVTFEGAVEAIVGSRVPLDVADPALVNRNLPRDLVFESSRLDALTQLGAAWPARFRCDDSGTLLQLPPYGDPADEEPVLVLSTGERGVVAEWQSPTSRDAIHNGVIARGEEDTSDKRAVSGFAWDADPESPTYWGGPFGEHPLEYASPLLATDAQARKAAETILARELRRSRVARVTMVPDPRLEVGDVVELDTETVSGIGRISSLALPLTAAGGAMTLQVEMGTTGGVTS